MENYRWKLRFLCVASNLLQADLYDYPRRYRERRIGKSE